MDIDSKSQCIKLFDQIKSSVNLLLELVDSDKLDRIINNLNDKLSNNDIWVSNTTQAKKYSKLLNYYLFLRQECNDIKNKFNDIDVFINMDNVEDIINDINEDIKNLYIKINKFKYHIVLSDEYDSRFALMFIRTQAGGKDASQFTKTLMNMYIKWCEKHKYQYAVNDISYGDMDIVKTVVLSINFDYAYGKLHSEHGTHRLVRISPFDSQKRRHTSFVGVEILPVVEEEDNIIIDNKDLRIDVFRSSGPGGQSVNTTDSAVRITHIPTNIVVSCQNERSQLQNRIHCMKILSSRLLSLRLEEQKKTIESLKDYSSSWGTQIRNYIYHPYKLIKDVRTGYEEYNIESVLNGDIDNFIDKYIEWKLGKIELFKNELL